MSTLITVRPAGDGWRLSCDVHGDPVAFSSGARAEAAARSLALDLADKGHAVKIEIWLRDGRLAGRLVCTTGSSALGVAA